MWTYSQSTGELVHNGELVAKGYSGHGDKKNQPEEQVHLHGPLPRGGYHINPAYDDPHKGPIVMHLLPRHDNQMFGRAGFLIHGDSMLHPGEASEGCIVLPRDVRRRISECPDR